MQTNPLLLFRGSRSRKEDKKYDKMKNILTGDDAILAYEQIQASYSSENTPSKCGYFISDDCDYTSHYDKGTVIAFDSVSGGPYEDVFSTVQDAIDWINR